MWCVIYYVLWWCGKEFWGYYIMLNYYRQTSLCTVSVLISYFIWESKWLDWKEKQVQALHSTQILPAFKGAFSSVLLLYLQWYSISFSADINRGIWPCLCKHINFSFDETFLFFIISSIYLWLPCDAWGKTVDRVNTIQEEGEDR